MRILTTFSSSFDELYNYYNDSEKGKELLKIDGIDRMHLDIGEMSKAYFSDRVSDISADANANCNEGINQNNYSSEIVKGLAKLDGYFLLYHYSKKRFGEERAIELIKSIWRGDLFFHDSTKSQIPYCLSFTTSHIMHNGRNYGQLHSLPPKRADSFIAQVIESSMDLSQETAGAIAPSDMIINFAWYAKNENLPDDRVTNILQSFVHTMNNKFRVSNESPFSNISLFDRPTLENITKGVIYPDGTTPNIDYIIHIEKIFGEWFAHGDPASGLVYRFPIVTINLAKDDNGNIIDKDFLNWVSENNIKTGCFNIYINDGIKVASCCRMVNSSSKMRKYKGDSFGNGGISIGSHRVVTVNLPRIALKANGDIDTFNMLLRKNLEMCKDLLQVHREEILTRRVKLGFLKFIEPLKWFTLDHLFSTIGLIGIYETCKLMGHEITNEDGIDFTAKMLNSIEEFADKASIETGHAFNCEEVPGEGAAIKLCQKDKVLFGEEKVPFELYSNQYIPLIEKASMPERIQISGKFMDILSGGGILHLNVSEQIQDSSVMKHLIEYCVKNNVSHFAVNYGFGLCEDGHSSIVGTSDVCPTCGKKITKRITRVVGYFSVVDNWAKVRREYEFPKRVFSQIEEA